jgi:hypothetical protein
VRKTATSTVQRFAQLHVALVWPDCDRCLAHSNSPAPLLVAMPAKLGVQGPPLQ